MIRIIERRQEVAVDERLDPRLSLAFRDRGAAYYFKKDYVRSIKDYDEAIHLDPRSDRAYSNRGAALQKLGRKAEAIADESEAMTAFDAITYNKGQAFIRMLENYLGADAFRDGIRRYMAAHAYSNTTTADLWQALEAATGKPVASIAVILRRRTITMGGSSSSCSLTMSSLSVAPNKNGPWMRKTRT